MNWTRLVAASAGLGALLGCDAVHSSAPMGERPASIVKAEWEGWWLTPDGPFGLQVVDEDEGELMMYGIELGEQSDGAEGPPDAASLVVHLRAAGNWLFASVPSDGHPGLWDWVRIKNEGDYLILWTPRPGAFRRLVSEGALPGTVEEREHSTTITLGEMSPAHYDVITGGTMGVLMDWDDPMVLPRLHLPGSTPPPPSRPEGGSGPG